MVTMMKAMSSFSDVRTQHVFGWISVFWFASAVSLAVSQGVELQTISQVVARCGENVTLTCDVQSSGEVDIKSLSWLGRNKQLCEYGGGPPDPEVMCESLTQPLHHSLAVTLLNVMPLHQGEYICKLHSSVTAKSTTTVVTVQDCLGVSGSSINESHAECWFSGVYPSGTIHWFQGDVNFTDTASTKEEVDHHGRYNISSVIDVQRGNVSQPFTCSLWITSSSEQLSSKELPLSGKQAGSSAGTVKLQWICVMVEIMMVTLMMQRK